MNVDQKGNARGAWRIGTPGTQHTIDAHGLWLNTLKSTNQSSGRGTYDCEVTVRFVVYQSV